MRTSTRSPPYLPLMTGLPHVKQSNKVLWRSVVGSATRILLAGTAGLRELAEQLVGLLFFRQRLVEELGGVLHAQLQRERLEGAVAGDLVMLHRLRRGDQAGIERFAARILKGLS